MTPGKPLPCAVCGQPVRKLGAVKWSGSGDPPDGYLTRLVPVCAECLADPDVRRRIVSASPAEATH